jgi:hypothetical protein
LDEDEYKDAYNRINTLRCVFEKAMCSLHGQCSQGRMFRLADRQGFGCESAPAQQQCSNLLNHLRRQTRFVFKIPDIDGPLPHNKEIRVQNGGLVGLRKLLDATADSSPIADVATLVQQVIDRYGSIDAIPYTSLMQSVTAWQTRPKHRSGKS